MIYDNMNPRVIFFLGGGGWDGGGEGHGLAEKGCYVYLFVSFKCLYFSDLLLLLQVFAFFRFVAVVALSVRNLYSCCYVLRCFEDRPLFSLNT